MPTKVFTCVTSRRIKVYWYPIIKYFYAETLRHRPALNCNKIHGPAEDDSINPLTWITRAIHCRDTNIEIILNI